MRKLPKIISELEFLKGLKKVKDKKHKLAFILGFYQCLRVSEVVNLQLEQVDTKAGFIHIKAGKGNKDRDIPIMPEVIRFLRHLPIGISRQALHKAVKKYYPNCHFHTLRHSGASYYLNNRGIDTRFIQQLLGHSRLDTTQIYTHVNPENLKKAFLNPDYVNQRGNNPYKKY